MFPVQTVNNEIMPRSYAITDRGLGRLIIDDMSEPYTESRWIKSSRLAVVPSENGERFAILHLDATQPVVLTGTAAAIWSALDECNSLDAISSKLSADYGIEKGLVEAQIKMFLDQLATQELIIKADLQHDE